MIDQSIPYILSKSTPMPEAKPASITIWNNLLIIILLTSIGIFLVFPPKIAYTYPTIYSISLMALSIVSYRLVHSKKTFTKNANTNFKQNCLAYFFEQSPQALVIYHAHTQQILDCNQQALQFFQQKDKSNFLKHHIPHIEFFRLLKQQTAAIKSELQLQQYWQKEWTLTDEQQGTRWIDVQIRSVDKETELFVVEFQDVTTQKVTETAQRITQFAINQAPSIVLWTNPKGQVLYANQQAYQNLDCTPADLKQLHIQHILNGASPNSDFWQRLQKEKTIVEEVNYQSKNGVTFPVERQSYYVDIEGQVFNCSFAEKINPPPAPIQVDAGAALKVYAEKLEASNKELEQFAYVVSHDLQEPLRMISSYLQLLERRYAQHLDESATDFIQYAVDGAHRMHLLIQGLLSYSRVNTKAKPFEPTDCHAVLLTVLSILKRSVEENQAQIAYQELPTVMGDSLQLSQLFQNLISNALKYRSEDMPIIDIQVKEREKDWLFSVRDNGIGIEPQYQEKIFGVFQRLHTRNEYEGTGIGLAICQRIVHRHGGTIWVKSDLGRGATFYFTIAKRKKLGIRN